MLSACKSVSSMEIKDEQNIVVKSDMALTTQEASQAGMTKDKFCSSSAESQKGFKNLKQTPYEENGFIGCRFEGTTTLADMTSDGSIRLAHDKGKGVWTLTVPKSDSSTADQIAKMTSEFKYEVSFPGEVTKATKGKIDGNKVTFTDVKEFFTGDIQVEAKDKAGFPILPLLLGLLGLAILAGLAWYFLKGRGTRPAATMAPSPVVPAEQHPVERPAANPSDPVVSTTTSTYNPAGSQYGTAPAGPVDAPTQQPGTTYPPQGPAGQAPVAPPPGAQYGQYGQPNVPGQVPGGQTGQVAEGLPTGQQPPREPGSQY